LYKNSSIQQVLIVEKGYNTIIKEPISVLNASSSNNMKA